MLTLLSNIRRILGEPFFSSLYENNPLVFGSFPSLHVAYPVLIAMLFPNFKWSNLIWLYPIGVFGQQCILQRDKIIAYTTIYLNHHYLLDIIGGIFYCVITIELANNCMSSFCSCPGDKTQSFEV